MESTVGGAGENDTGSYEDGSDILTHDTGYLNLSRIENERPDRPTSRGWRR
jgi:hypothetical protein